MLAINTYNRKLSSRGKDVSFNTNSELHWMAFFECTSSYDDKMYHPPRNEHVRSLPSVLRPQEAHLEHAECQLFIVLPLPHGLLHVGRHGDRAVASAGSQVVEVGNLGQLLAKVPGRYLRPLCIFFF